MKKEILNEEVSRMKDIMEKITNENNGLINEISNTKKTLNSLFRKYSIPKSEYSTTSIRGFGRGSNGYRYLKGMVLIKGFEPELVRKIAREAENNGVRLGLVHDNAIEYYED
jgi:hypothetical protein